MQYDRSYLTQTEVVVFLWVALGCGIGIGVGVMAIYDQLTRPAAVQPLRD